MNKVGATQVNTKHKAYMKLHLECLTLMCYSILNELQITESDMLSPIGWYIGILRVFCKIHIFLTALKTYQKKKKRLVLGESCKT